jgi:hypothetical protein
MHKEPPPSSKNFIIHTFIGPLNLVYQDQTKARPGNNVIIKFLILLSQSLPVQYAIFDNMHKQIKELERKRKTIILMGIMLLIRHLNNTNFIIGEILIYSVASAF